MELPNQILLKKYLTPPPFEDIMNDDIYEEMKKLKSWTINEGIMLMIEPQYVHNKAEYRLYAEEHLLPFQRAFEDRSLTALPPDYCRDNLQSSTMAKGWERHIGDFKIRPIAFLTFVQKYDLFKIPPELKWVERQTESGKTKYYWASNIPEEDLQQFKDTASNAAKGEPPENDALTGKERQELGRLRNEKATMDVTVEAAVQVGQFIQEKAISNEIVVRKNIEDFVYKIDKNIPKTRIDLIWKTIPEEVKSGPGRPKKK